ncbi:putative late blight resistance protein homolog R1A-10 [Salvia miltiorrhiza]|uniref:putative late blight resistance protein homolog R1A-10 n=1 Tax=Salvia miltiorrhiza TaxID=226208 RepID=UPI0025AD5872|nr:putative late blight resistance protein homolog R1A-10 [Salvia miltiorrhiza]
MEAVELLLDKLQQLCLYQAHLIKDCKDDVENLEKNLQLVKAFLKDSSGKKQQTLVLQIRDLVYEMEDIIDAYVTNAATNKSKSFFSRVVLAKPPVNLLGVDQRFQSLLRQIETFRDASSTTSLVQHPKQEPPIRDNLVVGLEDVTEEVKSYLTEETNELDVITIVGMPGIGKTALAWKTYADHDVINEFPIRIWIDVSSEFTMKEVFFAILKHIPSLADDINDKNEVELAQLVAKYLKDGHFLIVMDDVLSTDDWDKLQFALPKSIKKGKVLITSCNESVAWYASKYRSPLRVRFLNPSESWSLLRVKVFGNLECPTELEDIGRLIADQCEGLPLAIVTVARALLEGNLSSSTTIRVWTKVCSRVPQYTSNIFHLNLPYQLRMCFLYFGMFPSDFEIPAWTLICMWIAEGFVQPRGSVSLEETAESYLKDLVSRNLVRVEKIKSNGKIKSCRIHGMLHEYCRIEAGKEGVLQQVQFSDGDFDPPISDLSSCYRLCITSNILDFLACKPSGPRVRSFGFSHDEVCLPLAEISTIPEAFKQLRVLAVPIKFTKIPSDMYRLVHLRFLTLSSDLAVLPASLSKLWSIQTLTVNTTSCTLEMKADICQFTQLRHFKTNVCATLATTAKHGKEGENLQTLATVSPASCTKEFFARACKLKKLGIRGKLSLFLDGEIGSFDCLGELTCLENLKLRNDVPEGQLRRLPPANKFPPSLRNLTLADTQLDWSEMRILGLLKGLEVLKLKCNAFKGGKWVTDDGGFEHLESLYIEDTDLVVWVASAHHFPRLTTLELRRCEKLDQIPIQLADIPTLQFLELYDSRHAAASAIRIRDEIQEHMHEQGPGRNATKFTLSIYPPTE